jgi:hypothetical protein
MDNPVRKSCWGVATWSVVILGGALLLGLALGDFGPAAIVAP